MSIMANGGLVKILKAAFLPATLIGKKINLNYPCCWIWHKKAGGCAQLLRMLYLNRQLWIPAGRVCPLRHFWRIG